MNVDCIVPHHALNPHKLLRTTLMLLSMHVSEQYAAAYITDESLSVTSWLLTALFSITYQAQRITENHIKAVLDACE